jgi:hypothetical protein
MANLAHKMKYRVKRAAEEATHSAASLLVNRIKWKVDPRVTYPCYKSLDEFIDIDHLVSLDEYLTELLRKRVEQADELFDTGLLTREAS